MPASNSYYFFDCHGFIKTNPARTFFLGVLEAVGAAVATVFAHGGSSGVWFFGGLGEYDLEDWGMDG